MVAKTQVEWVNDLKIALINEDLESLARLYAEVPKEFETVELAQEAAALMAGVITMLKNKREEIQKELDLMKKAILYQQNQLNDTKPRLDVSN